MDAKDGKSRKQGLIRMVGGASDMHVGSEVSRAYERRPACAMHGPPYDCRVFMYWMKLLVETQPSSQLLMDLDVHEGASWSCTHQRKQQHITGTANAASSEGAFRARCLPPATPTCLRRATRKVRCRRACLYAMLDDAWVEGHDSRTHAEPDTYFPQLPSPFSMRVSTR